MLPTYLKPCKRCFASGRRCNCIISGHATATCPYLLLQLSLPFIDIPRPVPNAMLALSTWLQPEHYVEQVNVFSRRIKNEAMIDTLRLKHMDSPHLIIYGALIVTAVLYLVGRQIRKINPNAPFSLRPRTPDPEEKAVDVTTFAAKRMNPTERPPGSKSSLPSHRSSSY